MESSAEQNRAQQPAEGAARPADGAPRRPVEPYVPETFAYDPQNGTDQSAAQTQAQTQAEAPWLAAAVQPAAPAQAAPRTAYPGTPQVAQPQATYPQPQATYPQPQAAHLQAAHPSVQPQVDARPAAAAPTPGIRPAQHPRPAHTPAPAQYGVPAQQSSYPPAQSQGLQPSQAPPTQAPPTQAQPTQAQPTQAWPAQAQPSQAQPSQAQPTQAWPAQAQPTQAQPSQAQPTQAWPTQAQPSQAWPSRAQPGQPGQPAQAQRTQAQPAQVQQAQAQQADPRSSVLVEERPGGDFDLHQALAYLLQQGGSDLHLSVGSPPLIRLRGDLEPVPDQEKLTPQAVQRVLYAILTQKQRERFEEELELDFAYAMPGASRFRVNVYRQRESLGAAFRVIPYEIKTLEKLGINPQVASMAALPRGMVLVTGPTGSGKSTTLAAIVDLANRTRRDHIMTVEDPIEFLHQNKNCLVNQREVGEDTHSFAAALKHVLRQDPDIILVGEMRDLETISVALTAAETGHLVFATLHTQDAAQTIDRVIDVFPPHQQQQVRVQLAGAIQGVVCQTLCRTADGKGRVAATEVMFATPAIRNLIREGKTHQIYSSMQAGAKHGMQTMDQNLADLVRDRKISVADGLEKCHHVDDFKRLTGQA